MHYSRHLSSIAFVIAISGCSGSGSPIPFSSQDTRLNSLTSETSGVLFTRVSSLPTSGSVSYQGVAELNVTPTIGPGTERLLGSMGMNISFSNNTANANITGLVNSQDQHYEGRLSMTNGVLDRSVVPSSGGRGAISGDLEGTLTRPVLGDLEISASLNSNFVGNGSWMAGSIFDAGDITDPDAARVTGEFILDRQ